jgi:uncharacterized protein involved in type VI secretion and phage assembly
MASMEASGLRYTLRVDTLAPETFVVSGFTLHEQLSTLFILELKVASTNPSIAFGTLLDCAALNIGPTLPYHPAKNTQSDELCISTFRHKERLRPSLVSLKDYSFKNPGWQAESCESASDLEHQVVDCRHYDYQRHGANRGSVAVA